MEPERVVVLEVVTLDRKRFLAGLIDKLLAGELSKAEMLERLLAEMGRGGRMPLVDAALPEAKWLEGKLCEKNYLALLTRGKGIKTIKKTLAGRVLVTRRGEAFNDPADLVRFYYGLLWIVTPNDQTLPDRIESALLKANFSLNLRQIVKV